MARKLAMRRDRNPHLDEMSSDGEGVEFGQPLTNQAVPTIYPTLDNPVAEAPIDRKKMPRSRPKQFGFRERPKNFNDLDVGEAGAGVSQFRRAQFFSRVFPPLPAASADLIFDIPIAIATARSADTRPRFWHVSFFATSSLSDASNPPLVESGIVGTGPTATVLKGRVMVYDESGGRYFDVNIHGTSSFSFYGWGVTTFILLPSLNGVAQGSEVDAINPGATPTFPDGGIAENTMATGRIIPTFQNVTQITDQATRTVSVGSGGTGFIQIPPGSRFVRIRANTIGAVIPLPATYRISFEYATGGVDASSVGRISMLPGRLESARVAVPNATFLSFVSPPGGPAIDWVATFIVEA